MSFWCHRLDQNSNENIVKISGLKIFVASWGLPGDLVSNINKPTGSSKSFQEAPMKLQKESRQKSLQYFRCYFGPNDDTKKTFRKTITLLHNIFVFRNFVNQNEK